ncbi:MAG: translocase binding subunit (ATPase) [Parcubacteria group bacterium Gr01-1014_56]|nr:MAG: translocase binding subunit (ATPase) [Parcubacteria group bacterium Gr01-1014_56]
MFSLETLFGAPKSAALKGSTVLVEAVNRLEPTYKAFSNEELRLATATLRARLTAGETLEDVMPEAFALVRESAVRTVKLRPFDVQLIGGYVLHNRGIAEMKTGEGKTLVATLPAYLNALLGNGVHIITVNDYLARRDAVWMGQVYALLGLSVGIINHDSSYLYDASHTKTEEDAMRDEEGSFRIFYDYLRPATRVEAYQADITYGTNSEFGFDYLRDNISFNPTELRQRGHTYAIVDEIDSILIDEARTPLIISAPAAESEDLYRTFAQIATKLNKEVDFTVDEKRKAIQLTDEGITKAEKLLGIDNLYTEKGIKYVHHLETAVRAQALYARDKEYVVKNGEIVIVDEFTGRLQPGRRWSEGLHQAIEAKEGVIVQKESRTYASITYQNYFRLYDKLAGMTGTAKTSSEEFYKVYGLEVADIPTNKPVVRKDENDLIFQTEVGKFKALARNISELHKKGQPVLVGTVSIEKNELLSTFLRQEGIPHEILNAKNHEREGEIIASAGERGRVTVATNMAGRGVDIKLGGALASMDEADEVRALGGLFVIGTERHEARRIDNQLRGRSGRQGDPGETRFFVSLEDSLMRVFASDMIKNMMGRFGIPEDEPIENKLVTRALESAQTKIEGFNFDARKHVLEFDNVLDKQRRAIYDKRRKVLVGSGDDVASVLEDLSQGSEEAKTLLTKKEEELGREMFLNAGRHIVLRTLDLLWVEHLESMEYLRGSVNLRAYGQRDPLVEYRKEGTRLYKDMEMTLAGQVFELIEKLTKEAAQGSTLPAAAPAARPIINLAQMGKEQELGRNDPCPCGSGKKYKNCGLKNTDEHQKLMAVKK